MNNQVGQRAGCGVAGFDCVRRLVVDVMATGFSLSKAQTALQEAVRAVVGDDTYNVRTVYLA